MRIEIADRWVLRICGSRIRWNAEPESKGLMQSGAPVQKVFVAKPRVLCVQAIAAECHAKVEQIMFDEAAAILFRQNIQRV